MDAEKMRFPDHVFHTVTASFTLHHLRNIKQVLGEIKRVLKPRGLLILQEMISDGKQSESQKTDILIHHWNAEVDSLLNIPHFKTLKKEKLIEFVNELELESLEMFEATRYVQCLHCEKSPECSDPRSKTSFEEAMDDINRILERAQSTPMYEKYLKKAERLRKRLAATGYSPASCVFFIGRKKPLR
jgi:SAM-dependent methyltransferase